ncbi:MAG: nucleotidyltransferase domain-containing protein [Oscillospiraceae bacterium]|nr:nucleotidyltransferase domain-containing protein [Oscillospiraceae bacterium]
MDNNSGDHAGESLSYQMKRYLAAVDSFVDKVRSDPNVIAVILYGSVANGTAWEKSDVDITVVVRDQNLMNESYGIYEDNITFGLDICRRSDIKRTMEKSLAGSVGHSINATSKIVYTRDDSLYEYLEENKRIGKADMEKAIFNSINWLIGLMDKIEKWLVVKNDVTYARYYALKAAEVIAQIEVTSHGEVPTREGILQAEAMNPELIATFYHDPMNRVMDEPELRALLKKMDDYIALHMDAVMNVTRDFFGDGEIKTGTMVSKHFLSDMHFMHPIIDYLCDRGILDKVSQTIRITPKSKPSVEEVAFIMPTFGDM